MAKVVVLSFVAMAAIIIAVGLAADDLESREVGKGCNQEKVTDTASFDSMQSSVFASLLSVLTPNKYATSEADPVYGLAVCMKYLSGSECSECFKTAATQLKRYCPRSIGGRIYLDGCFLRYENWQFYSQAMDGGNSSNCLPTYSTNDSNSQVFSQRARGLSAELITNASANNGYAVGSVNGSLYGLAQCWWPSVSTSGCQTCLNGTRNLLLECSPMTEGRGLEAGCFMRYSNYSFYNPTSASGKSSSKIVAILLGSIGGAALVAVLCLVLLCQRIRHWKSNTRPDDNRTANESLEHVVFQYEVLRDSTGNFDRSNLLGRGGFGEVYKGRLPDGRDVAVKKLNGKRETNQAAEEFLTEVRLLASVRQRNLVRLLGCCTRGHERLLVYEFMSNNSLEKHLFGEIRNPLSWDNRFKIIVGTARGLAYLHEDSNVRIIHRDIKCGNILLDNNFHPKIADFGMARFFPEGETHVSTGVGGTIGYTAPEYAVHGQLTEKADVYSYGIVVLEIVSGRRCVDNRLPDPMQLLLQWAWNEYIDEQVLNIADSRLEGRYPREQILRVIKIALLCTQGTSALRPAMSQVLWMLSNNSDIAVQPTQPAFIDTAAGGPANSNVASNSETSASAPPQESHGPMTVSLFPR